MRKLSILAVLAGGVVDVVSSVLLGIPFGIYALFKVHAADIPKDQLPSAVAAVMHHGPVYFGEMLVGFACSVLGGYVAARLSGHDELLNGCLASFLCVALGILALIAGKESDPIGQQIMFLIASPLLSLLGGFLRLKQRLAAAQAG
jgi:hypothetical protein